MDIQSGFETIKAVDAWQLEQYKEKGFKLQKARPRAISTHRNET